METADKLTSLKGLKNTKGRRQVLSILKDAEYPLKAEEIFEKAKTEGIDLSTIYRTLKTFEESKIVKKEIGSSKECVYSLLNDEDSHVLVCTCCKKRIKIKKCPYHEANEKLEKETGFLVLDQNTEIYGLCPECRKKN